jgi:hypothetical protein
MISNKNNIIKMSLLWKDIEMEICDLIHVFAVKALIQLDAYNGFLLLKLKNMFKSERALRFVLQNQIDEE